MQINTATLHSPFSKSTEVKCNKVSVEKCYWHINNAGVQVSLAEITLFIKRHSGSREALRPKVALVALHSETFSFVVHGLPNSGIVFSFAYQSEK